MSDGESVFAALDPPKPAARVPAIVRPDFVLPTGNCPDCGHPCVAVVYFDIDSCGASLDCGGEECTTEFVKYISWPFVDEKAAPSDFEALGIREV